MRAIAIAILTLGVLSAHGSAQLLEMRQNILGMD